MQECLTFAKSLSLDLLRAIAFLFFCFALFWSIIFFTISFLDSFFLCRSLSAVQKLHPLPFITGGPLQWVLKGFSVIPVPWHTLIMSTEFKFF